MKEKNPDWPYSVNYGKENEITTDVLIVGAGVSGLHAARKAIEEGVEVAVVDKSHPSYSGSGGAGVDHWHDCCTNPACKLTPEEYTNAVMDNYLGWGNGAVRYISARDSYETLLELEEIGLKVRDTDDEFLGSDFRDKKTKLLFAGDYENKYCVRVWGSDVHAILYRDCKRSGIDFYPRVMITDLLVKNGRVGGAVGVGCRNGEFYKFKSKSTVLCTGDTERLYGCNTEERGFGSVMSHPNNTGCGWAMGWRAGAKLAMMEKQSPGGFSNFGWPPYGVGNPENSWFATTIVDSNGKEVPFVNGDGSVVENINKRYEPTPEQDFFLSGGGVFDEGILPKISELPEEERSKVSKHLPPSLTPDLPELIEKGEFEPPFYADLPGMPEDERKVIWDVMCDNEGKTHVPIHKLYQRMGFDPERDMLQVPFQFHPYQLADSPVYWTGQGAPSERNIGFCVHGGLMVDWDLQTTIEGLFAAGQAVFGGAEHAMAACSGRWAGAKAASYSKDKTHTVLDDGQIEAEKSRIYSFVSEDNGMHWKEFNKGVGRVMRQYCGAVKTGEGLKIGLRWIDEIREDETKKLTARNPHELMRCLECLSLLDLAEMTIYNSLGRRASSYPLGFERLDYPEHDPPAWKKFVTVQKERGEVDFGEYPHEYWLKPPNHSSYKENYENHKPW